METTEEMERHKVCLTNTNSAAYTYVAFHHKVIPNLTAYPDI